MLKKFSKKRKHVQDNTDNMNLHKKFVECCNEHKKASKELKDIKPLKDLL